MTERGINPCSGVAAMGVAAVMRTLSIYEQKFIAPVIPAQAGIQQEVG
jgi:hypothetical protein